MWHFIRYWAYSRKTAMGEQNFETQSALWHQSNTSVVFDSWVKMNAVLGAAGSWLEDVGFPSTLNTSWLQHTLHSVSKNNLLRHPYWPLLSAQRETESYCHKSQTAEKVSVSTTKGWVFPLSLSAPADEREREEVRLVSLFRHRMYWGLYWVVPLCFTSVL